MAKQEESSQYPGLDILRMAAAVLVIAVHTQPLLGISQVAEIALTGVFARLAVPFFMMCSGFFFAKPLAGRQKEAGFIHLWGFSKKILKQYAFCVVLYLPLNIYMGDFKTMDIAGWLRALLFDGSVYTLWYFPAVILGMWIAYTLYYKVGKTAALSVCTVLYLVGLGGDSYYGILDSAGTLSGLYNGIFTVFSYTRNGLFMAPIFILLGFILAEKEPIKTPKYWWIAAFAGALALMMAEGMLLNLYTLVRHNSMYLFLPVACLFLFLLGMSPAQKGHPVLRKASALVYIWHLWAIILVRGVAKLNIFTVLPQNSLLFFAAVCAVTALLCGGTMMAQKLLAKYRREKHE